MASKMRTTDKKVVPTVVSGSGHDLSHINPEERSKLVKERKLSVFQRHVISGGTEPPFTGRTVNGYKHNNKRQGTYDCAVCGLPVYSSQHKFESGTGWPSFYKPVHSTHVWEKTDLSLGMLRKEVMCVRCHAHQGHVFEDGPRPTGLRYCINAAALSFTPTREDDQKEPTAESDRKEPTVESDHKGQPGENTRRFWRAIKGIFRSNREPKSEPSTPALSTTG